MSSIKKYESVNRWLNHVFADGVRSPSTEKTYLHFLTKYSEYLKLNPDQIIEQRRTHLKASDEFTKRQDEEGLINWRNHLEKQGLARSSTVTATNIIKSFYNSNYVELKVKTPKSWPSTIRKVPTREELKQMVEVCNKARDKALILCLAQSGISSGDLELITYSMIKNELEKGVTPLHLSMERQKIKKRYDTFLGSNAIEALKQHIEEKGILGKQNCIFDISSRTAENIVKDTSKRAGLKPHVTPHKLRSFFNTMLKLAGCPDAQVEYWMGHVTPYGGAYFIPPIDEITKDSETEILSQRELYRKYEWAISI